MLRRAFIAASLTWAALLPFAAVAIRESLGSAALYGAALVYAVAGIVCHQIPQRSFQVWAQQLPVCARCTGIYTGAALAAIFTLAIRVNTTGTTARGVRTMLVVAALPTLATIGYEWSVGEMPSNIIRAVAALPLGAAASLIVLSAASDQVN